MKRYAAVLLVAITLGASLGSPVQAQRFGLFFGDERNDFVPERVICLSDYQIRREIAAMGYHDIFLNVPRDKHIQVRATQGDWVYLLEFNYCSAQIEGRERLRPAR